MKKLLLHCCCAPCASYVIKYLQPDYDITLFYYNPNTQPYEEYEKRREALETLVVKYSLHYSTNLDIIYTQYDSTEFEDAVNLYADEPEGGERCRICFDIRLRQTALKAKELGFDIFATTLSVSPHKNAAVLNGCGIRLSNELEVPFMPADFKKDNGYKQSIELSREFGLYRQNYCGCLYSLRDKGRKV